MATRRRGMVHELVRVADAENPNVGDLRLVKGNPTFIDGDDAIRQHIRNRLLFFRGEWFLDKRKGFPYLQDVLIKNPDLPSVRSKIRETILTTPGVAAIEFRSLELTANRQLSVSFDARLDDGETVLEFRDFILTDARNNES